MESTKIKLAKSATKFIAGRSVSMIVVCALKGRIPTTNKSEELQVLIGSYVIAGMVTDFAIDWTSAKFDEGVQLVRTIKGIMKDQPTTTE